MSEKLINRADLKGWSVQVTNGLEEILVMASFFCQTCGKGFGPENGDKACDLPTLCKSGILHMRMEHGELIPAAFPSGD